MIRRLTVVTGGTRGIGAAIALRLAEAGHDLVLGYASDESSADATASQVRERGVDCRTVAADLTSDAGVETLFAAAADEGRLTGLVNNAGATMHIGPLAETATDMVRRTVELNLTAALLCARAAVRVLGRRTAAAAG